MKSRFVYFFLSSFLGVPGVFAQDFSIKPLYESAAYTPKTVLPFVVTGKSKKPLELVSFSFENNTGLCGATIDPHEKNIFLLRCQKPVDKMKMQIFFRYESSLISTTFGPVVINNLYDNLDPIDPDEENRDPKVIAGKKIYFSYCNISCHQPINLAGRTVAQIQNALNTQPQMASLKTTLTTQQIQSIANYLESLK